MELEGSLPYSQVPATCPYPEPAPSSPHHPLLLREEIKFIAKIKIKFTQLRGRFEDSKFYKYIFRFIHSFY
jgi:hypothetical protein